MSDLNIDVIYNFQVEVFKKLEEAFVKFNITSIASDDVMVSCDIRGKCAGRAMRRGREYFLKFNREAIFKHYDEQVNSTIPHEVAHIVCMINPSLGKNHDAGWRRVARMLGDVNVGERTHTMQLTAARAKVEYQYNVNGNIVTLGPKRHARLQKGLGQYSHRSYGKITRDMLVGKKTTSPVIAKPAPQSPSPSSTAAEVGDIIRLMVTEAIPSITIAVHPSKSTNRLLVKRDDRASRAPLFDLDVTCNVMTHLEPQ